MVGLAHTLPCAHLNLVLLWCWSSGLPPLGPHPSKNSSRVLGSWIWALWPPCICCGFVLLMGPCFVPACFLHSLLICLLHLCLWNIRLCPPLSSLTLTTLCSLDFLYLLSLWIQIRLFSIPNQAKPCFLWGLKVTFDSSSDYSRTSNPIPGSLVFPILFSSHFHIWYFGFFVKNFSDVYFTLSKITFWLLDIAVWVRGTVLHCLLYLWAV